MCFIRTSIWMGRNVSILQLNVRNPWRHLKEELYLTRGSPLPETLLFQSFEKRGPLIPNITVCTRTKLALQNSDVAFPHLYVYVIAHILQKEIQDKNGKIRYLEMSSSHRLRDWNNQWFKGTVSERGGTCPQMNVVNVGLHDFWPHLLPHTGHIGGRARNIRNTPIPNSQQSWQFDDDILRCMCHPVKGNVMRFSALKITYILRS